MTKRTFSFQAVAPVRWTGRYKRPAGRESAYHVAANDKITVIWKENGWEYRCPVCETPAVKDLARSVNQIKRREARQAGGSFVINEFGQVICPIYGSTDRYLVGYASGPLWFEDLKSNRGCLCLLDEGMAPGDDWNKPYLGMKYQLHAGDEIYFWFDDSDGGYKEEPPRQDYQLIDHLRGVRPSGAMSFIVNQHGVVITKKDLGNNSWKGFYAGRVDYSQWFNKEG